MQAMEYIWHNGQFVSWNEAKIHVLSHSLHYGGGVLEGIRIYKTDQGSAVFRLGEHIDRLFYSMDVLKMKISFSKEDLIGIIKKLVQKNALEQGYIRPLVYFGYHTLGIRAEDNPVEIAIACWPWGAYLSSDMIDMKTSSYIRIHPRSTICDAKLTGHYLNSILASIEIRDTHYHEALFLDIDGYITEGVGENFFMVKDKKIYTTPLGKILPGITRDSVIEFASQKGYQIMEKPILLEEAYQADELFLTGTAAEITPVRSIDDRIILDGKVGPITQFVKDAYHDIIYGKNEKFFHYLTFIS